MNKLKLIIAVIAAFAGIFSVRADSNPTTGTNIVALVKKNPWVSSLAAGVTITRGNSDVFLATGKFQTEKKQAQNDWLFSADAAYGENNSVQNADTLHGAGQFNHLFNEKLYGYLNMDALHDGVQGVEYRYSASPGAGYYFVKTLANTLKGEIGPGVVDERLGDQNQTYMTLRLAEDGEHKISGGAKIWEKVQLLPQVDDFNNYIVNAELGLESPLTKQLSLQVTLDDDYANVPAAGRVPNDVKLVSGIVYKF